MRKKPDLASIPDATPETSFPERAKVAKKKASKAPANDLPAVKRSMSLTGADSAYLDEVALKLGAERGKSMSASEAMRVMIDHYRGSHK